MPAVEAPMNPLSFSFRSEGVVSSTLTRSGEVDEYVLPSHTRHGGIRFGPSLQFSNLLTAFAARLKNKGSYYLLRPFPYNTKFGGNFRIAVWEGGVAGLKTAAVSTVVDGITCVSLTKRVTSPKLFAAGDWLYIGGFARQVAKDTPPLENERPTVCLTSYNDGLLDKPVVFRPVTEIFIAISPTESSFEVTYDREGAASFGFDWYEYGPAI